MKLDEINENDAELDKFVKHAKEIGLKAETGTKPRSFEMVFASRDAESFDIAFTYSPAYDADNIVIEYVLGAGKQYRINILLDRFYAFDKNEVTQLHKAIQSHADKYVAAVKVVKDMPKTVKNLINVMVK